MYINLKNQMFGELIINNNNNNNNMLFDTSPIPPQAINFVTVT